MVMDSEDLFPQSFVKGGPVNPPHGPQCSCTVCIVYTVFTPLHEISIKARSTVAVESQVLYVCRYGVGVKSHG